MRLQINFVQLRNREIWRGYYLHRIMAIFGHVRQKEWENERMNNFSTSEEGKIDFAKKYLSCSNCSNNQNGYSYQLLTNTCLADSNGSSIKAIFGSAVTRSIATTASKVKFCQKEKCLLHRGDKMYRLSISRRNAWTTLERLAQDTKRWAVTQISTHALISALTRISTPLLAFSRRGVLIISNFRTVLSFSSLLFYFNYFIIIIIIIINNKTCTCRNVR